MTTERRIKTPEEIRKQDTLSNREMQVRDLMGKGFSNKEIAGSLLISPQTAKNYTHTIFVKTGLSRYEIIRNSILAEKVGG